MSPAARAPGLHTFPCESLSTKKLDWKTHSHLRGVDRGFPGASLPRPVQLGPAENTRAGGLPSSHGSQEGRGQGPHTHTHPEAGLGSAGRRPGPESLGAT